MRILVIDNYDSFTFNLTHILASFAGVTVEVMKNDEMNFSAVEAADKILLSPGPGLPREAGRMMEVIDRYHDRKPILGVCLGHQALAEYFGGTLINLPSVFHGIATSCSLTEAGRQSGLFARLPARFEIGRYHSWIADAADLPAVLDVTAVDDEGNVMAFEHRELPIAALQFHPESVLTPLGSRMLMNWMKI